MILLSSPVSIETFCLIQKKFRLKNDIMREQQMLVQEAYLVCFCIAQSTDVQVIVKILEKCNCPSYNELLQTMDTYNG